MQASVFNYVKDRTIPYLSCTGCYRAVEYIILIPGSYWVLAK